MQHSPYFINFLQKNAAWKIIILWHKIIFFTHDQDLREVIDVLAINEILCVNANFDNFILMVKT
jgi:hypothetical protein